MTFSNEWNQIYKGNKHLSIWPWSDLVSYVKRYCRELSPSSNVLELGCGAGANIPFFLSLPVNYYGIDGSEVIIRMLKRKFPKIKNNLTVADFTKDIPFSHKYDLVVDRGSLTCNSTHAIRNALKIIKDKIIPGGKYIGIDWFSTKHSDFRKGWATDDPFTKKDYVNGQFACTGNVHFSDIEHLIELFEGFEIEVMELKVVNRLIPKDKFKFAAWNFVAKKI